MEYWHNIGDKMGALDLILNAPKELARGLGDIRQAYGDPQGLRQTDRKTQLLVRAQQMIQNAGSEEEAQKIKEYIGKILKSPELMDTIQGMSIAQPKTRTPEDILGDIGKTEKYITPLKGEKKGAIEKLAKIRTKRLTKKLADSMGMEFIDVPEEPAKRQWWAGPLWPKSLYKRGKPARQEIVPKALDGIRPTEQQLQGMLTAGTKAQGVAPEQAPSITDQPKTLPQQTDEMRLKKIIIAYKRTPVGRASTLQARAVAKTHPNTVKALMGMQLSDIREILGAIERGHTDEQIMAAIKESTQ